MKKSLVYIFIVVILVSCQTRQQYTITSLNGERIPVLTAKNTDKEIVAFVDWYKQQLDSEMKQVIGQSDQHMPFGRPESLLTNLTSDIMQQLDESIAGAKVDLAIMNVHGHRAQMPKGNVTVGDIFEIYSFDNALVVLQLKGKDLMAVFDAYAKMGGAGISSTVKLKIKNEQLIEAKINGQSVDDERLYTIVTLDYLAEGNDGFEALKNALSFNSSGILLREYMLNYFKQQTTEGKIVSSKLDGRIIIE